LNKQPCLERGSGGEVAGFPIKSGMTIIGRILPPIFIGVRMTGEKGRERGSGGEV
jgi:hypothetical protein